MTDEETVEQVALKSREAWKNGFKNGLGRFVAIIPVKLPITGKDKKNLLYKKGFNACVDLMFGSLEKDA